MSKVQLAGNASGTGIFQIAAPNSNTDRTLTLPDNTGTLLTTGSTGGVSQAMLAAGVAGNGPTFSVYRGANYGVSANTNTKVPYDTVEWDSASCFNTSTNRFTPNVAGYYQIIVAVASGSGGTAASGMNFGFYIYKNGSYYKTGTVLNSGGANDQYITSSFLVNFNGSTDYVEIYYFCSKTININGGSGSTFIQGFLARSA